MDFGFANYAVKTPERIELEPVTVNGGKAPQLAVTYDPPAILTEKGGKAPTQRAELPESVDAPVKKGDTVGRVVFYSGETEVAQVPVYAAEDAERNSFTNVWGIILGIIIGRK